MPSERSHPSTVAAVVTSTGLIAQQVAGKAIRDALFLSSFQAKHLPHAMAATSVVSLFTVALVSWLTTRFSPKRLIPWFFGVSSLLFVLEWLSFAITRRGAAFAVYMHTAVLGPVLITMFWSLVNERYDPHSAKAAMARIAGGGTLGGVLGGVAAWRASTLVSAPASVLLLAVAHGVCAFTVLGIPRDGVSPASTRSILPPGSPEDATQRNALRLLRDRPFLRNLAFLVLIGALMQSLLDYVLGVQAVAHYGKGDQLLGFFSLFGLGVAILSLAIQLTLGRVAMQKVALAVHIGLLPGVVALGGALGMAVPGLLSAALLRGLEMVHRNTLFRSAYELLYTPVPELQKRATKALIDVGFDRAGTVIGSVATMTVIYFFHANQLVILGLVVFFALSTFPIVRKIHAGYVEALEGRLKEGAAKLQNPIVTDGPASSDASADAIRDGIITKAEEVTGRTPGGLETELLAKPDELVRLGAELLSRDPTRTRKALYALDLRTRILAGHAILLLSDRAARDAARSALKKMAPAIIGQLVDALLAEDLDVSVRRHLAAALLGAPTQRTADGLLRGLSDARFEIRYASGRALARLAATDPEIVVPRDRIIELVILEAKRAEKVVLAAEDEGDGLDEAGPLGIVLRDRVSRGLEHVFVMLSLFLEHDALRLCFRALHQDDNRYRGTALEYLDTVLPAEVRDAIWPLLGAAEGPLSSPRPANELLAALSDAIELDVEGAPDAVRARMPSALDADEAEPTAGRVEVSAERRARDAVAERDDDVA